jgi:hypothetical protein
MVRALRTDTGLRAKRTKRRTGGKVAKEQERIIREATLYLIQKHGMFLVATRVRKISIREISAWVVSVTLRYDKGDEGYIGDLLYDGEAFTFLTDPSVVHERICRIAGDPAGLRQWNEYRATTFHAGKA